MSPLNFLSGRRPLLWKHICLPLYPIPLIVQNQNQSEFDNIHVVKLTKSIIVENFSYKISLKINQLGHLQIQSSLKMTATMRKSWFFNGMKKLVGGLMLRFNRE
jgi:hypothetical protein